MITKKIMQQRMEYQIVTLETVSDLLRDLASSYRDLANIFDKQTREVPETEIKRHNIETH